MKQIFIFIIIICLTREGMAQLYISPGTTLHLSGNARVALENMNLVNNGNISAPDNARVIFNGADNNGISGTRAPDFAELEIAKIGSGLLTLHTDIGVSDKIVFTSNLIELNNYMIDLGTHGFLAGEKESSRITGIHGGEVLFTTTLNAPSGVNPGNLGAVITSVQNLGTTTIQRGHQSQTNTNGGGSSIHRYFDIIPTGNSALNATLRINYFDAEKNSLDENNFEIFKSDDNVHWVNVGQNSRDAGSNYVVQTGLNDFSRWTLSTSTTALPITGLQLSGNWNNHAAHLKWTTLTEYHNSHFTIERKYRDDLSFMAIGRKNSPYADGNSQTTTRYNWTDFANADKGPILYRLQQQDMDGKSTYSHVIVIQPEPSHLFIQKVFPNLAVTDQIYIQTGSRDRETMQLSIYDMKGSLIFKTQLNYQSQWLNLPQISAGNYKMFIRSGYYHWEGSFVKE